MSFADTLIMLESDRKIERDKGIKLLEESLQLNQLFEFTTIIDLEIEKLKESSEIDWKKTHALLSSLKIIISKASDLFGIKKYIPWVVKQLEHAEFRVRLESGAVIEEMARFDSSKTHEATIQKILELIQINLKRQNEAVAKETYFGINETEKLFHDTSGWKYLESSMKALQSLIKGCGITYVDLISLDDVDILIECSKHTNRFVRETSMYVFETLFEINVTPFLRNNNKIAYVIDSLIQCLSDNWSQVRLAASVATRKFLMIFQDISDTNVFRLLPPVCLNRHYLAEGVKLYNVNTWKIITKNEGLKIVSANIDQFITFYVSQSKADNHAVREAACHCLAELGYLLGQVLKESQLQSIYDNLLLCFKDESWPVRDTACYALGIHVSSHPFFFQKLLSEVFPIFFSNLSDSIPSVRVGAAISLSYVSNSFPSQSQQVFSEYLKQKLSSAIKQDPDSAKYNDYSKKPAIYGVAKKIRDNDSEIHSDQIMYSCGSLAPKMKSGLKSGSGCSSHSFTRDAQPWEISDGCICLFGEISKFYINEDSVASSLPSFKLEINEESKKLMKDLIIANLEFLHEALSNHSYTLHYNLLQTFCQYFPYILKFLEILDIQNKYFILFLDQLDYSITQKNSSNLEFEAETCLQSLSKMYSQKSLCELFENHYGDSRHIASAINARA